MKQVWQTVEKFHMLEQNDRVLAGVSGGPDSIALLHLLNERKEQYGIQLFAVHVNHQLRAEAETETLYVEEFCRQRDIPLRVFSVDVKQFAEQNGMSLEQAGHEVRFDCFRQCAEEWNITKLALGHHGDDRAESVLLHLVQGCGLDGLTAMPPKDGWIIRPLAQMKKQQLIEYCHRESLQYFIDSTNLEPDCLRNQIRLEILPQLKQYNPQIGDALLRLQEICSADDDYLEQCTAELWKQHGTKLENEVQFPAEVFRQQHLALQRRVLRYLYRQLTGSETDLTFRQMEQMQHIALQQNGSQQVHLTGDVVFFRQYDRLGITWRRADSAPWEYTWTLGETLEIAECGCVFQSCDVDLSDAEKNSHELREGGVLTITADAAKLPESLQIRCRKPGDSLTMPYGHKKLKDFFIEKKIPAQQRDAIPILLSGEEILWIPGYYAAECVRITGETRTVCRLSCCPK